MSKSLYKDARGIEFCDLMQRMRERGYKPADVARLCHLSKAAVSGYLSGKKVPGLRTLILFRQVVEAKTGEASAPADGTGHAPLAEQLRELKARHPEGFEAVAAMVRALLGKALASGATGAPAALAESHTPLPRAEKSPGAGNALKEDAHGIKSPATAAQKLKPPPGVSAPARRRRVSRGPQPK